MSLRRTADHIGRWGAAALVATIGLGLLNLSNPFTGDQSLFDVGGRMMAHGAIYYREMWDIKQPGIFLFYEAAGRLFGFGPVGVHFFELLWMVALAVVLLLTLRPYIERDWVRAAAVVAAVGGYYLLARAETQTLIEALVALPLYVVLWTTMQAVADRERRHRWLLIAGVATGIVGVFKLVVLAVPLWFVLTAAYQLRKREHTPARELFVGGLVFAIGVVAMFGPFVVYYAIHDLGALVYRTTFVYPPQITRLGGMHNAQLAKDLIKRFVLNLGGLTVLALVALRTRARGRDIDHFTANLVGWVVVGSGVVLAQKWNSYQTQLLLVPLALLAALAVDQVRTRPRRPAALAVGAVAVVLLLLPVALQARKGLALVRHGFALTTSSRLEYQRDTNAEFALIDDEVRALGGLPGNDPIYVLGNPLYYQRLDRTQALSLNGWSPEQWLDDQWRDFVTELDAARPRFVFVDHLADALLADHDDARALLDRLYAPMWTSTSTSGYAGTWYQLR